MFVRGIILFAALAVARLAAAEEIAPEAIADAVKRLGSETYQVREHASDLLWSAGESARGALTEATHSNDREVVFRAKELLERLDAGVRPDTPPAEATLFRSYRLADETGRLRILEQLRRKQSFDVLIRLLRREPSDSLRTRTIQQVVGDRNALAQLLIQDRHEEIGQLMQFAAMSADHQDFYSVYLALHGGIDERVAALADAQNPLDLLLYAKLLRLQNRPAAALAILRKIPPTEKQGSVELRRSALENVLLQSLGKWNEAAEVIDRLGTFDANRANDMRFLAESLYCHRMAGNADQVATRIGELQQLAAATKETSGGCVDALLANDRFDEALDLAKKHAGIQAFRILSARMEYAAALEAVGFELESDSIREWYDGLPADERARSTSETSLRQFAPQVASLLVRMGEVDKAQQLFDHLFERGQEDVRLMVAAISMERQLRLPSWKERLVKGLDWSSTSGSEARRLQVLAAVEDSTGVWWNALRAAFPKDDALTTVTRLDDLIGPRWGRERLSAEQRRVVEKGIPLAEAQDNSLRYRQMNAIGTFCINRDERTLARRCFEQVVAVRPYEEVWLRLGDIAAAESRWEDAATIYESAWNQAKKPLPLFLQGVMLEKLGRKEESDKAKELARLLPLGNESERALLAEGLASRQLAKEADTEWRFVQRFGQLNQRGTGTAMQSLGNAQVESNPLDAAALWERARMAVLLGQEGTADARYFLRTAAVIHRVRARGLIASGKIDEAVAEARLAVAIEPEDVDIVLGLCGDFEKASARDRAEPLFELMHERYLDACEEFPASAFAHNGLAWLNVKTDHDLEEALVHAKRAVELMPDDAAPIDTLALVHFRRGEHDEAIRHARRCVELLPGSAHARAQLREFEQASAN